MKSIIIFLLFCTTFCSAQRAAREPRAPRRHLVAGAADSVVKGDNNKRISFIVGIGPSYSTKTLYHDPVIDAASNFVRLQKSSRVKAGLSLGIAYTPYTYDIISSSSSVDANGQLVTTRSVENVQKGITTAVFVNPLLLSKVSENPGYFDSPDFGFGFGWRFAGGLSILATTEFYFVRQPRNWFLEEFGGNNASYAINNEIQKSIDLKDNNIFTTKPTINFGIKFCYSFDIIKRFISTTTTTTSAAGAGVAPGAPAPTRTTTTTNQ